MSVARSRGRRLRSAALWTAGWLVVLLAALAILHGRFLGRLTHGKHVPDLAGLARDTGIPAGVLSSIGSFELAPGRRDLRTLSRAHPGTIRILAIGDSFTFGDEVDDGRDYPSLLQARFRAAGMDNVEVVNLGSPWQGLGQSAVLLDRVGRLYQPDFVLLGPYTSWPERDQRFEHTNGVEPYYLHGRFVLDGDGLRFIEVAGAYDAQDRFAEYHRLFPRLDHLRYDRNPPDALAELLPAGKTIANPFYYSKLSQNDEQELLHRRLLQAISRGPYQTIRVHFDDQPAAAQAGLVDVSAPPPPVWQRMPAWHFSAMGNRRVAALFFAVLTDRRPAPLDDLELADPPDPPRDEPAPAAWTSAEIWFDGHPFGGLFHRLPSSTSVVEKLPLARARSLLVLRSQGTSLLGGAWLPLDVAEPRRAQLFLGHDPPFEAELRRVPGARFLFVLDLPVRLALLYGPILRLGRPVSGKLLVDGRRVANLRPQGQGSRIYAVDGSSAAVAVQGSGDDLDPSSLPERGTVYLSVGGTTRVPIATFRRAPASVDWDDHELRRFLRRSPDHPGRAELGR